jgi:transcriptional regulator with XRE-family HTH domain
MKNVVNFKRKPRTFTTAEAVLDEIRERVHMDGRTQKAIGLATGVSQTTIGNIASGKTKWPRHTTIFPLLTALRARIRIEDLE